jgi:type IV secretory pathway VirB10-like protein
VAAILGLVAMFAWITAKHAGGVLREKAPEALPMKATQAPEDLKNGVDSYLKLANEKEPEKKPAVDPAWADMQAKLAAVQAELAKRNQDVPKTTAPQIQTQASKASAPDPEAQRRAQEAREAQKAAKEELKKARSSPIAAIRHDKADDKENIGAINSLPRHTAYAGSIINCEVVPAINSESPGSLIVRTVSPVYDSLTGSETLIPPQSIITVDYKSAVFGEGRVNAMAYTITLDNGDEIKQDGLPLMDLHGQTGLDGKVDNKWGTVLMSVLVGSSIRAGSTAVQGMGNGVGERAAGTMVQDGASQTNMQLQKSMNVNPVVRVPASKPCMIELKKSLTLRPYVHKEG